MTGAPARLADGAIDRNQDCPVFSINSESWMKFVRRILLAVAATTVLPLGVAVADVLECTMDPGFDTAYIAPKIRIEYDAYRTARISDSVIETTDLPFVEGSVEKETDTTIRFFWVVKGVKVRPEEKVSYKGNRDDLIVRLSVKRADGTAVLTQRAARYQTDIRATGQCRNVD